MDHQMDHQMNHQQIVRGAVAAVPDFPRPGILFRDITPVMEDPVVFRAALDGLAALLAGTAYDRLGAIESRGFIFGAPLAVAQGKGLVLLRKAGKLPGRTRAVTYDLEYGQATLEVHEGSFRTGDRVVIVDDLLATGGTAEAAAALAAQAGAQVVAFLFLVELEDLGGRAKLASSAPVFSLVRY